MHLSHHSGLPRRRRAPREHGYTLITFALLLVPLLLMSGFAVDVGYWYNRASNLQKAADAAALAGVVWLPNLDKADTYARQAATRNGFTDGVGGVEVDVARAGTRRLRVTIDDPSVGSFFWEALGGHTIELDRSGTAEYVLPVPMGSPRNYFGTGSLLSSPELIYQSVNPSCTSKVNGDRHQSPHFGPLSGASLSSCPATPTNVEYRDTGYELYIDAVEGRTDNIDVMLYDPRYNEDAITTGTTCTFTYDSYYTDLGRNRTVSGRIQYWTGSYWREIAAGQSATARYVIYGHDVCTNQQEAGIDTERKNGEEDFTYALYAADSTPLDDDDNPLVAGCQKTYTATTAFQTTFLGSARWNVLCTITPGMASGQYILRVHNGAPGVASADGSNQWGLVAKYRNAAGDGLCDGRVDAACPRVYGRDAISVYANTSDGVASFFLSEIEAEHSGKTLELELWDPGEGGQKIEFLQPNGANSWTKHNFSWSSYEDDGSFVASGNNVSSVDVTGSKFNGRLLRIEIPLDGYNPPSNNRWWKIQYTFGSGSVTDRTTWSARVTGDPVHLVEEEAT